MRGAVVAFGERRPLAGLALARGCAAAGDAAVEHSGLDLLLDERTGGCHAFLDRPGDLGLRRDREVAADVLEERALRLGEVERVGRESLHRLLARLEDVAAELQVRG